MCVLPPSLANLACSLRDHKDIYPRAISRSPPPLSRPQADPQCDTSFEWGKVKLALSYPTFSALPNVLSYLHPPMHPPSYMILGGKPATRVAQISLLIRCHF